jgi:hypothetical protein
MALSRTKRDKKMKALERLDGKARDHRAKIQHHEEALEAIEAERQKVLDELAADELEMYQQRQLVRRELFEFRKTLAPRNALLDPFGTVAIEEAERRLRSIRPELSPGIFLSGAHKFALAIHPVVFPKQATYNEEGGRLWYWLQKLREEVLAWDPDWENDDCVDIDGDEEDEMEEVGTPGSVRHAWVWEGGHANDINDDDEDEMEGGWLGTIPKRQKAKRRRRPADLGHRTGRGGTNPTNNAGARRAMGARRAVGARRVSNLISEHRVGCAGGCSW